MTFLLWTDGACSGSATVVLPKLLHGLLTSRMDGLTPRQHAADSQPTGTRASQGQRARLGQPRVHVPHMAVPDQGLAHSPTDRVGTEAGLPRQVGQLLDNP